MSPSAAIGKHQRLLMERDALFQADREQGFATSVCEGCDRIRLFHGADKEWNVAQTS
jgi:hypothetical protein